ncbi:MAG: hypothetical protein DHS20C12_21730 [Pseudohongiella sp.]|nr:MAG: hypothetical protein DHS20C12_21730 [Pseudohongiella sp.]
MFSRVPSRESVGWNVGYHEITGIEVNNAAYNPLKKGGLGEKGGGIRSVLKWLTLGLIAIG